MTPSSLSRLDNISKHPLIAKGVKKLHVDLYYFDLVLAHNLQAFAEYSAENMLEWNHRMESMINYEMKYQGRSEEEVLETIRLGRAAQTAWEGIMDDSPDDPSNDEDVKFRMILRKAHAEYNRLFVEQETLLKDGGFESAVATAMSRIPVAIRLEMKDDTLWKIEEYTRSGELRYHDFGERFLVRRLTLPINFEEARSRQLVGPPSGLLLKLPVAIHKAGVSLTHLDIKVSPLLDYSAFASSAADLRALTASAQTLKHFSFEHRGKESTLFPIRDQEDVKEGRKKLLKAFLDTPSLEHISMDFPTLWDDENQPSYNFASILYFRTWENLGHLSTNYFPLQLEQLEQFANKLHPIIRFVYMSSTRLLSGTWAEALDLLRQASLPRNHLEKRYLMSIRAPRGGELDTMSREEISAIFEETKEKGWRERSLAEKYMSGLIEKNHLRDFEGS